MAGICHCDLGNTTSTRSGPFSRILLPHKHTHGVDTHIDSDEISQNPIVVVTVCVLVSLYLIGLIICQLYDRRDVKEDVGLTIMSDMQLKSKASKFYLITVVTGCNFWAGTTSSVSIVIYGSNGRSQIFTLKDRTSTVFLRGDIDSFLVACDKDLGILERIRIWTDHTGIDPAWYCRKILIRPVSSDSAWYFYVYRWLAVTAEESTVILDIPATSRETRRQFSVRFKENLMEQFDNVNLWLSIFRQSPSSTFTRCQRLSCAFAMITVYLVLDIWLHGTIPDNNDDHLYELEGITLDLRALLQSLEIVFISLPIGIILIYLFRNIRHQVIPTLIIWENVVPAKEMNRNAFLPSDKEKGNLPGYKGRKVQFPANDLGLESDESSMIPSRMEIDPNVHPEKFDGTSMASTVSSAFSIPSTDIQNLEGWIQDRTKGDENGVVSGAEDDDEINPGGNPFIQSVDSKTATGDDTSTIDRLGRIALISSVRDYDPDTFIFQGDNDIAEIEDLIDKQINENRTGGYRNPNKKKEDKENGKGKKGNKEIILGTNKDSPSQKKVGEKTPWKKAVTGDYLDNLDHDLQKEMESKQFTQNKDNWEAQLALEMCLLPQLHVASFTWPWWFVYVAWFICVTTIVICLYFTLLLGIHSSYTQSLLWLQTLILSFLISVFIGRPINALFFTTIVTWLGQRQVVKERLQVIIEDSSNLQFLDARLPYKYNLFKPVQICQPLRGNEIFRLTIDARRRKEIRQKLLRLILCLLLLGPLIAVSYSGHNHYNYEVTDNIRSLFQLNGIGGSEVPFNTEASIYEYLENVVVENLHPEVLYNGNPIPLKDSIFMSDQHTLLVGVARIRQQRVKSSVCPLPLGSNVGIAGLEVTKNGVKCNKQFSKATQDRDDYHPTWQALSNATPAFLTTPNNGWEFHGSKPKPTKIISWTFKGHQGRYDGGGYLLELGRTRRESRSVLKYMKKTRWLDHRTRAIFVELTLLNPNINKFVDVVLLIEIGATASFTMRSWITPMELIPVDELQYSDEKAWTTICLWILLCALVLWTIVFIYDIVKTPKHRRFRISGLWLDFCIIVFVIISLIIAIITFASEDSASRTIEGQRESDYVSIQTAAYWNDILRAVVATTQALIFIKLWQLLMFTDQRFLTFALTLTLTANYLAGFLLILSILLCGFATASYFLFGQDLWEFSTWGECMISLVAQITGVSFFDEFVLINPYLGPVFAILYGYLVIFIGLNFIVALLDLGVTEAKQVVQQRRVWLTYSQYFKNAFLKSIPFFRPSIDVEEERRRRATNTPIHPDRWNGMKKETIAHIRAFLVAIDADLMKEMQQRCNKRLTKTRYRVVSKRKKALLAKEAKQRHIEDLRKRTSEYIKDKLGHNVTPKEFKEYSDFNKIIVKLRVQKMEKKLGLLNEKMEEFFSSRGLSSSTASSIMQ